MANTIKEASAKASGIKEALSALGILQRLCHYTGEAFDHAEIVRTALESEVREVEPWETIEGWLRTSEMNSVSVRNFAGASGESWQVTFDTPAYASFVKFNGFSRLEALTKAAAWCRAELSK